MTIMAGPLRVSDRPKPSRQTKHLTIDCLVLPRMDEVDFAGREVLSRIPDSTTHVIAKTRNPCETFRYSCLLQE
jgi:hypothetical protein